MLRINNSIVSETMTPIVLRKVLKLIVVRGNWINKIMLVVEKRFMLMVKRTVWRKMRQVYLFYRRKIYDSLWNRLRKGTRLMYKRSLRLEMKKLHLKVKNLRCEVGRMNLVGHHSCGSPTKKQMANNPTLATTKKMITAPLKATSSSKTQLSSILPAVNFKEPKIPVSRMAQDSTNLRKAGTAIASTKIREVILKMA